MENESGEQSSDHPSEMKQLLSAIETLQTAVEELSSGREDERELRESNDRLKDVIENIGEAFFAVDDEFNFVFVNRRAAEMLDRPAESLIGKNLWTEFPADAKGESFKMHQKALAENKPVFFDTYSETQGRWLSVSLYPDKRGGISDFFRDITDEREKEKRDHLVEEQLQMILESATDYAIFTLDENGFVTSWNTGAENTFGYSRDEIIGKNAELLFTPEDRRRQIPELEMKTALEEGRSEDERWHLRKDGTQFFASGVMQPMRSDGSPGFVKICRDQTEKINAQDAVRDRLMLQRIITTQEDERSRIARDLHDHLGQQLTALRLKLEGIKTNYGAEPAMMKALEDTQMVAAQIDKDLSFLTWELRPTALDNLGLKNALANFVAEWSKNYEIPAEFHGGTLRGLRLAPETEVNLYRIAQEALNNSLKHAKASAVSVLLEFRKNEVVLVIEDNGRGFNPKVAARRGREGKGLGLIGMRERAALIGGAFEIESSRGKGTTVIARAPIRRASPNDPSDGHMP